jgi:hypothetical protein
MHLRIQLNNFFDFWLMSMKLTAYRDSIFPVDDALSTSMVWLEAEHRMFLKAEPAGLRHIKHTEKIMRRKLGGLDLVGNATTFGFPSSSWKESFPMCHSSQRISV